MEPANNLSERLETQERGIRELKFEKNFRGRMPPDPTRSLDPRRSFRKSVSIYPRSEPVLNLFCGETGTFSFREKK